MKGMRAILIVVACALSLNGAEAAAKRTRFQVPAGFSVPSAMKVLFGNYDKIKKYSRYDVPQTTTVDLKGSGFEKGDEILVRPFWARTLIESGKTKVVLLTYSVPDIKDFTPIDPDDRPFSCHACSPLIGGAVFSRVQGQWRVESSRTAVATSGGWGQPPEGVQLIKVGPDRFGIELTESECCAGSPIVVKSILVPWNGKFNESIVWVSSSGNLGQCGSDGTEEPCYANHRKLNFVAGSDRNYYDIVLTLTGTDANQHEVKKIRRLAGSERRRFVDGRYETVSKSGDTITSDDEFIEGGF